jgi:hypothetical protein
VLLEVLRDNCCYEDKDENVSESDEEGSSVDNALNERFNIDFNHGSIVGSDGGQGNP